MTTKDFIEKAIEGGWKLKGVRKNSLPYINPSIILLNPFAWQAVGKVERWKLHDSRWDDGLCTDCYKEEPHQPDWKENMHRMIDALAEGKTLEAYLETL